jgi:hypothetical protein
VPPGNNGSVQRRNPSVVEPGRRHELIEFPLDQIGEYNAAMPIVPQDVLLSD